VEEYLKTAGPEADEVEEPSPVKTPPPAGMEPRLRDPDAARKASAYIEGLGGRANIVRVDACAETRLRVVVRDKQLVREGVLMSAGIAAVVHVAEDTVHLLAGLNADQYAAEMRGQLSGPLGGGAPIERRAA